jgi:DNA-binding NtrC family response regulator
VTPDLLSPELARLEDDSPTRSATGARTSALLLAAAVDQLERDMIRTALDRSAGNISETARQLGLTRRGLYLKLRRLGFESPAAVDTK